MQSQPLHPDANHNLGVIAVSVYLGLDWEEKCLSPQNNTRSVSTASNTQVRKKIYQGSSQQWKKYQPFLNGVLDGL